MIIYNLIQLWWRYKLILLKRLLYRQTCVCMGQEHSISYSTGLFGSYPVSKGWLHSNQWIAIDKTAQLAFDSFACSVCKPLGQGNLRRTYQYCRTHIGTNTRSHRSSDGISVLCLGAIACTNSSTDAILQLLARASPYAGDLALRWPIRTFCALPICDRTNLRCPKPESYLRCSEHYIGCAVRFHYCNKLRHPTLIRLRRGG